MKFLNFLKDRLRVRGKIIFGAIGAAFLLFFGSAHYTYALFDIGSIEYNVVSTVAGAVAYILAWIFGVLISIEAWFIGIVMNINANLMSTSLVQTGFSISLSVANLAFVLGIIVIALATILRIENYSIKKMLWKLVVMAILVNFGLVIIAPIFAIGNSFTNYFLNCITPSAGGCSQNTSGIASYDTFATTMVSKFNPGALLTAGNNITTQQGSTNNGALGATSGPFTVNGKDYSAIGAAMVPIFSLVFTIIDFVLIVFVLGAFLVMLMIRYVYIAILAILLPFAWAAWVFPSFSSMFSKWWNKFLQWTFFAPIFMFFLYLAFTTIGGTSNMDAFNSTQYLGTGDTLFSALTSFFGTQIQPIFANFLSEMVLGGLIIGGMIAADSMGVKFAGSAMKVVQNAGKGIQGYIGKQSKKAGRAAFRGMGGENAVNKMRKGDIGSLGFIDKIPLVGAGTRWAVSRGASAAGRAIAPNLSNSDLVDAAKKKVPENPATIKENLKGNMNTEDTLAHLAKLIEKGELDDSTMVGSQTAKKYLDTHGGDIKNYGFTKSSNDADKLFGSNEKMRTAEGEIEKLAAAGRDTSAAMVALQTQTNKFIESLQKSDISKMNVNDTLGKDTPISRALASGFLNVAPHLVSSALPKMKSPALKNFNKLYTDAYNKESMAAMGNPAKLHELGEKMESFEKSMQNNVLFSSGEAPSAPAPSMPPTP